MIRIRPATAEDIPAVQRITLASPTAPHWTTEQFGESIATSSTATVRRTVLLAELTTLKQQVIGFAVISALVSVYPIDAELESIAVDPDHRGKGAGAALLQAATDWLTSLPTSGELAAVIRLEVRVSNHPAIRLYRSHGFVDVATRTAYYANPREDAICMEREIVAATAPTSRLVIQPKALPRL
ncbi:GNAT family N-acetyltransferase [Terriglobus roseus]|uniref:Ribosomal-protein-alanine N-acetyltransferase n=1 Tax=Terriglobus roseus TaxID=392734 RepID=A0A1H4RKS1_9BACT|nr:GNAT family N-acetyltransferase [Terriglobus roseus]SEC32493.1 ribosomal-protein-alanine N-acetyltransferase [Terriglobus roseus]